MEYKFGSLWNQTLTTITTAVNNDYYPFNYNLDESVVELTDLSWNFYFEHVDISVNVNCCFFDEEIFKAFVNFSSVSLFYA